MIRGKRRSLVWNHFTANEEKRRATCGYCNTSISFVNGAIGNLHRHMKFKHPTIVLNEIFHYGDIKATGTAATSTLGTGAAAERTEDFTSKLLQTVEKHPELYQGGYSAEEKDQHWSKIATELGEEVRYCKEEWRCLRKLYQSYSKGNQEEFTSEMEEQIEQMSFLAPFIEQETFSDSEPEHQVNDIDDDPLDSKTMVFEDVRLAKRKSPLVKKSKLKVDPADEATEEASKKLFLLSLLSDVKQMNNQQMRKFKMRVLEVVDEILNE